MFPFYFVRGNLVSLNCYVGGEKCRWSLGNRFLRAVIQDERERERDKRAICGLLSVSWTTGEKGDFISLIDNTIFVALRRFDRFKIFAKFGSLLIKFYSHNCQSRE